MGSPADHSEDESSFLHLGAHLCNKKMRYGDSVFKDNNDDQGGNALHSQLWHACAGPLAYVPRRGDKIYYFPQGHIEQILAYTKQDDNAEMPVYNIPFRILCKVVHVDLKIEANSDEVFAEITLLPQIRESSSGGASSLSHPRRNPGSVFIKKLTPSDRSTHGGFSIPKRYANDFFPPLDMSQTIPTQDLVVKDLHGTEWQFRHMYRGQPKRHLITSGWSRFLAEKKLVAGDHCIFVGGENGEIYVGIRRAKKLQYNASSTILSSLNMQHGILCTAYYALSSRSMFTVYYRPRSGTANFMIPYDQYMKSAEIEYSVGTKFSMKFESEECYDDKCKTYEGTVLAEEDLDSVRWCDSEWKRLKVQWDEASAMHILPERVSHWSIKPIGFIKKNNKFVPSCLPERPYSSTTLLPFVIKEGKLKSPAGVFQGQEIRASDTYESGTSAEAKSPHLDSLPDRNVSGSTSWGWKGSCNGNEKVMLFGANLAGYWLNPPFSHSAMINEGTNLPTVPPSVSQPRFGSDSQKLPQNLLRKCSINNRTCTKVLRYDTAVGRSVYLTHFSGYEELISELDKLFDFEGALAYGNNGWKVIYKDHEGDMLLLGDCHWQEFRGTVQKIFICPRDEMISRSP